MVGSEKTQKVILVVLLLLGFADLGIINFLFMPKLIREETLFQTANPGLPQQDQDKPSSLPAAETAGPATTVNERGPLIPGLAKDIAANNSSAQSGPGNKDTQPIEQETTAKQRPDQQVQPIPGANEKNHEAMSTGTDLKEVWILPAPVADIHFQTNQQVLTPSVKKILRNVARTLKNRPDVRLLVRGHTDQRANAASNRVLGRQRAQEVANFLVAQGVVRHHLAVEGVGETEPLDPANTEKAWAKNRRVQFVWQHFPPAQNVRPLPVGTAR